MNYFEQRNVIRAFVHQAVEALVRLHQKEFVGIIAPLRVRLQNVDSLAVFRRTQTTTTNAHAHAHTNARAHVHVHKRIEYNKLISNSEAISTTQPHQHPFPGTATATGKLAWGYCGDLSKQQDFKFRKYELY